MILFTDPMFGTGSLKEWTLILYGTSEHPYQPYFTPRSDSRMLEIPNPEWLPEESEQTEEEEYSGENFHLSNLY